MKNTISREARLSANTSQEKFQFPGGTFSTYTKLDDVG